jgi:hypothetical protein
LTETRAKTAADYAATAVAPVLIFLMISSLANFLMLVLYHGGHPQRVAWTLMMFTLGTVGIARVAIEKDRAYSLGYAGILGFVAFLAMLRFVDSPIFSAFILVVIAYLSDRIVHDCTLIDDSVDASGQGLIDSGRLFVKKQIESSVPPHEIQDEPVKATRGNRQNQPGRTVMYLALGALPLFGLGQFFLREDAATWGRAQWLLGLYLFASLSLLVTTSFLGLRRYLRQRRVDMPTDVSVAWLAGGLFMIALILLVAFLAPLPGQAIASFQLPNFLDSPGGLSASKFGWGDEAADKSDPNATSTGQDPNQQGKEVQSIASKKGAPAGDAGDGDRKDGPAGQSKGGDKASQGGGDQQSDSESKGQSQSQSKNQNQSQSQSQNQSEGDGGKKQSSESQSGEKSQGNKQSSTQPNDESRGSEDSQSQNDTDAQQSQSERDPDSSSPQEREQANDASDRPREEATSGDAPDTEQGRSDQSDSGFSDPISNVIPAISGMVRFLVFLVLMGIVVAFVWLNRAAILAWWQSITAAKPTNSEDTFDEFVHEETGVPPRAFSSYRNPFGSEQDPRRIVVITFAAFEAWTREQGATRGKNETPSEFIRRVAGSLPTVSSAATQVVDSYNRIVYGRGNASKRDLQAAREVWNAMQKNLALSS